MAKPSIVDSSKRKLLGLVTEMQELTERRDLPLDVIDTEKQIRHTFDENLLQMLAESIRQKGVLQPIVVRPSGGRYVVVAGERRLRAARLAGLTHIPVTVRDMDEREAKLFSGMENFQREDLNVLEETEAVLDILEAELQVGRLPLLELLRSTRVLLRDHKNQDLGDRLSATQQKLIDTFLVLGRFTVESFVSNRLPVLEFPEDLQAAVAEKKIWIKRAITLSQVQDPELRQELLELHITQGVPFEEIKVRIDRYLQDMKLARPKNADPVQSFYTEIRKVSSPARLRGLSSEKKAELEQILKRSMEDIKKLLE